MTKNTDSAYFIGQMVESTKANGSMGNSMVEDSTRAVRAITDRASGRLESEQNGLTGILIRAQPAIPAICDEVSIIL